MKTVNVIIKIVAALAAVAGIVFVVATYGDKIVAWAKKLLGCCPSEGECECECFEDETVVEEAIDEPAEEAVEEAAEEPAEEAAEEPVGAEGDFEE